MRSLLAILLFVTAAQAAPVPNLKDREAVEKRFGKINDPKGETGFRMDRDTLVVTMPANAEKDAVILSGGAKDSRFVLLTCPSIRLNDVKGEFEVEYSVTTLLAIDAKPIREKGSKISIGAGLSADFGENGKLVVTLQSRRDLPKEETRQYSFDVIAGTNAGVSGRMQIRSTLKTTKEIAESGKWKVRQVFKKGMFHLHCTAPDDTESEYTAFSCCDADPAKLSLVFFHSSNTEHQVRIDDFKITPIGPKK